MAHIHLLSHVETGNRPVWPAAVWAGLAAGLVFLILEMVLAPLVAGTSPWVPVRMIGAIALGRGALPPPATFDAGIVASALLVHFALAALYGAVLALLVFRLDTLWAVLAGVLFGCLLYLLNFYGYTGWFPWFAEARGGVTLFAHSVFGLVAAWVYKELAHRRLTPYRTPA